MVDLKSINFKEILLTGFSVVGAVLIVVLLILFGKSRWLSTVGPTALDTYKLVASTLYE